jgi:hypothetical protein
MRDLRRTASTLAAAAVAWLLACAGPPPPAARPVLPPPPPVAELPQAPCLRIERIEVYKRERLLQAHCEGGARVAFPVALGRGPDGPKRKVGDLRTPQGLYQLVDPPRPSRFHRFLPLDYPSLADAEFGLASGTIGPGDHARILAAHRQGRLPPQTTALGGDLGLHGEGPEWRGFSERVNWTEGCLALADAHIAFLAERVEPGVPVLILPAAPEGAPEGASSGL